MAQHRMQLEDWFDDLCVRFIINLPEEDLSSVARICFQVEEAQWFYEDFIRPLDPSLPSLSLRDFCLRIFQHCPLLSAFSHDNHMQAFDQFLQYKTRVPVRGAIILNHAMDSVLLVKGWKKNANWSFPRGKINKDEDDLDCAIREVYEETGYDINAAGLVPDDRNVTSIQFAMREQQMKLFVFRNVPMDTHFEPRTRKEISKIEWWRLSDLPTFKKKGQQGIDAAEPAINANKFYMVAPFLNPLKKWISKQHQRDAQLAASQLQYPSYAQAEDFITEDEQYFGGRTSYEFDEEQDTQPSQGMDKDTVKLANLELQRRLKMQPPTQGLQPGVTSSRNSPIQESGRANALMDLLHGPRAVPAQMAMPPTSLDHNYVNLTHVQPPRQYPPQLSQYPMIGPPPVLLNSQEAWLFQNQYLGGHLPPSNMAFQQHFPPPQAVSYRPQYPVHQQHAGHQAAVLAHPQPLPPQVQKIVFASEQVEPLKGGHEHPDLSSKLGALPFISKNSPSMPIELNNHRLSLLNAFTGQDTKTEQQNAPRANSQTLPSSITSLQDVLAKKPQNVQPDMPKGNPAALAGKQGPGDQHRTSLLNLFKPMDGSRSMSASTPASANGNAIINRSLAQPADTVPQGQTHAERTKIEQKTKPAPKPVEQSAPAESNSPFRPTAILARPIPATASTISRSGPLQTNTMQESESPSGVDLSRAIEQKPKEPHPFQPQILRRDHAAIGKAKTHGITAVSPIASLLPTQLPSQPNPKPHLQADKLLSMFRNATPTATHVGALPLQPPSTGFASERILISNPQSQNGTASPHADNSQSMFRSAAPAAAVIPPAPTTGLVAERGLSSDSNTHTNNLLSMFRKPSIQSPLATPVSVETPKLTVASPLGSPTSPLEGTGRRESYNTLSAATRADLLSRLSGR